jgi:hypothetical protein
MKKHQKYNPISFLNDIVLIKLLTNVTLNNLKKVTCLPKVELSNYPFVQVDIWTTGWADI